MDVTSKSKAKSKEAPASLHPASPVSDPLRQGELGGDTLQDPLREAFGGGAGRAATASKRLDPGRSMNIDGRRATVLSMTGEVEQVSGAEIKFNNEGELKLRVVSGDRAWELVICGDAGEVVDLVARVSASEAAPAEAGADRDEAESAGSEETAPGDEGAL